MRFVLPLRRLSPVVASAPAIVVAIALSAIGTPIAVAADKASDDKASAVSTADADLTPAEKAERESRKACKVEICRAFHAPNPEAGNVSCNVVKSWRKAQLDKIVGKMKVSWPYGPVVCKSSISLPRADMSKALKSPAHSFTLQDHAVTCRIERDKGEPTEIDIHFAPSVTFEKGKATKASVNWGTLKAPTMLKGLMWTATAADNATGLLSGMLVDDINTFTGAKCDEVRADWAKP